MREGWRVDAAAVILGAGFGALACWLTIRAGGTVSRALSEAVMLLITVGASAAIVSLAAGFLAHPR